MNATPRPSSFWIYWLLAASAGVVTFGLVLVLAPALTAQGFSLLVYASPDRISGFGPEQVRYISLISGFWRNAMLNSVFQGLFAIPLWATRTAVR